MNLRKIRHWSLREYFLTRNCFSKVLISIKGLIMKFRLAEELVVFIYETHNSTSHGGSLSDELRSVNLHIVKDDWCKKLTKHYPKEMICAGVFRVNGHGNGDNFGLIGGRDACQGDSGGPLICEIDGYAVLAGITR